MNGSTGNLDTKKRFEANKGSESTSDRFRKITNMIGLQVGTSGVKAHIPLANRERWHEMISKLYKERLDTIIKHLLYVTMFLDSSSVENEWFHWKNRFCSLWTGIWNFGKIHSHQHWLTNWIAENWVFWNSQCWNERVYLKKRITECTHSSNAPSPSPNIQTRAKHPFIFRTENVVAWKFHVIHSTAKMIPVYSSSKDMEVTFNDLWALS